MQVQDSSNTPSEVSTATEQIQELKVPKLNRKQRRATESFNRRIKNLSRIAQQTRLAEFKKLTSWKDKEVLRKNRMTDEQIASVFRVALARLFKGKEIIRKRKKVSFDDQLTAIVRNVKKGFKYKADVAPANETPVAPEA